MRCRRKPLTREREKALFRNRMKVRNLKISVVYNWPNWTNEMENFDSNRTFDVSTLFGPFSVGTSETRKRAYRIENCWNSEYEWEMAESSIRLRNLPAPNIHIETIHGKLDSSLLNVQWFLQWSIALVVLYIFPVKCICRNIYL